MFGKSDEMAPDGRKRDIIRSQITSRLHHLGPVETRISTNPAVTKLFRMKIREIAVLERSGNG